MSVIAHRLSSLALLAAVSSLVGVAGCVTGWAPEGVVGGVDLPSDLSLVLREGMRSGDLIARFGAPAKLTRVGQITTLVYYEVYQEGHNRVTLFGTPVGSDGRIRTQLHLVFFDDALMQAWVDLAGIGQEPERKWLLGAPKAEGDNSSPRPAQ